MPKSPGHESSPISSVLILILCQAHHFICPSENENFKESLGIKRHCMVTTALLSGVIERIDDLNNGQPEIPAHSSGDSNGNDIQPKKVTLKVTTDDIAKKLNLLEAMLTMVNGTQSLAVRS